MKTKEEILNENLPDFGVDFIIQFHKKMYNKILESMEIYKDQELQKLKEENKKLKNAINIKI